LESTNAADGHRGNRVLTGMILLVDDNLEQLDLRRQILEREGFAVATAGSASDAVTLCAGCDAVVMDLRLPSLADGLGLIRELNASAPQVPILVHAGLPEELKGRPEQKLIYRTLRKGTGTGALIELLHAAMKRPTP
jgi:CheY-like chemotaxis protein